jgi:serine/threonine protein kinase
MKIHGNESLFETEKTALLLARGSRFLTSLLECFESTDHYFLVMELCMHGSLQSYCCNEYALPPTNRLFYAAQLLLGVGYLHENHCLHRFEFPLYLVT